MARGDAYRWAKLRKALRGGFGYAEQQRAWDAVLPDWRWGIDTVNRNRPRGPLTDAEHARLAEISAALRADNRRLAGAWYQLLMQDIYRSCPALGGWFPC